MADEGGSKAGGPEAPWHTRTPEATLSALGVDPEAGLSSEEVQDRLRQHGPNRVEKEHETRWWEVLLRQLRDPLIYILFAAGAIALLLAAYIDAAAQHVVRRDDDRAWARARRHRGDGRPDGGRQDSRPRPSARRPRLHSNR